MPNWQNHTHLGALWRGWGSDAELLKPFQDIEPRSSEINEHHRVVTKPQKLLLKSAIQNIVQ